MKEVKRFSTVNTVSRWYKMSSWLKSPVSCMGRTIHFWKTILLKMFPSLTSHNRRVRNQAVGTCIASATYFCYILQICEGCVLWHSEHKLASIWNSIYLLLDSQYKYRFARVFPTILIQGLWIAVFSSNRASPSRQGHKKHRLINNGNLSTLLRLITELWVTQRHLHYWKTHPSVGVHFDRGIPGAPCMTYMQLSQSESTFPRNVECGICAQALWILQVLGASRYLWVFTFCNLESSLGEKWIISIR